MTLLLGHLLLFAPLPLSRAVMLKILLFFILQCKLTLLYICSSPFHSKSYIGISEHLLLFDHDATSLLTASLPNIGVDFTQIWYFVCRFN